MSQLGSDFYILKLSQKVLDISDLSGTISLLEKDGGEETQDDVEENEDRGRTNAGTTKRSFWFSCCYAQTSIKRV